MNRKVIFIFSLYIFNYLCFSVTSSVAQEGAAGQKVVLRFDWPVGTSALVKTENLREKRVGGRGQRIESSGLFRMRVDKLAGKKLAVAFTSHGSAPKVSVDGQPATGLAAMLATVQAVVPTIVVDETGKFAGVQDMDSLRNFLNDTFEGAMAGRGLPAQAKQLLDQVLSTQVLTQAAANEWYAIVGFWVGREFVVDRTYHVEAAAPLPMPGTPSVKLKSEIKVVGKPFPCKGGRNSPFCVRVDTVSRPDQAEVKTVLESFLKKATEAAGKDMKIIYKDLDIITRISIVTEVDTLKPHEYRMEKEVNATMIGPGGKESKGAQVDRRHSVYTY